MNLQLSTWRIIPAHQFLAQEVTRYRNMPKTIENVPTELVLYILSFLHPTELAITAKVCRGWRVLSYDNSIWSRFERNLPGLFPSLRIFDKTTWETFGNMEKLGLSFENDPPANHLSIENTKKQLSPGERRKALIPLLKALTDFSKLPVENNEGMTLLTIPKGLSFSKIEELSMAPLSNKPIRFSFVSDEVYDEFEKPSRTTKKTYQILLTNSVLTGTKNLSLPELEKILLSYKFYIPNLCMPSVIETVSMLALSSLEENLLSDEVVDLSIPPQDLPSTFTYCSDKTGGINILTGDFDSRTISAYFYMPDGDADGVDSDGIGAMLLI